MGRRSLAFALAVLTVLALGGCDRLAERRETRQAQPAGTGQPATGSSTTAITVDGLRRMYRLYVPPDLPPSSTVPLVVMLHGGFGDSAQAEKAYGWDEAARRGRFVVAYPDGVRRAWNVGAGCCGKAGSDDVDDVAFITAMVTDIGRRMPVDNDRVYATGISNGGMMSYRLACDTGLFAAVAPVAATLLGSCPAPRPVSVLHIHGTSDANVRMDGLPGEGTARIDGPPVPSVLSLWRRADGCPAPTVRRDAPLTTTETTCPGGRVVELVTVDDAGHQWPGSTRTAAQKALGSDPPSTAMDATATIWAFFNAHAR